MRTAEINKAWRVNNRERLMELNREYAKKRRETNYSLTVSLANHHLSREEYDRRLEAQGGRCANRACPAEAPGGASSRNWHIDHNHACCPGAYSCGKCVRGLLCRLCNTGLGMFGDNAARMRGAIEYLEEWSAR